MYTKAGEKEFLKLYIGLSSCHQNRPTGPFGWHIWCSLAEPSKGQCTISKILSSLVFSLFIEQNIFFPETCFACIISEPKFTVCDALFQLTMPSWVKVMIYQNTSSFFRFCLLIICLPLSAIRVYYLFRVCSNLKISQQESIQNVKEHHMLANCYNQSL